MHLTEEPFFVPVGGYGILQGVHLSPLGFAACQSKKCTNVALLVYFLLC